MYIYGSGMLEGIGRAGRPGRPTFEVFFSYIIFCWLLIGCSILLELYTFFFPTLFAKTGLLGLLGLLRNMRVYIFFFL